MLGVRRGMRQKPCVLSQKFNEELTRLALVIPRKRVSILSDCALRRAQGALPGNSSDLPSGIPAEAESKARQSRHPTWIPALRFREDKLRWYEGMASASCPTAPDFREKLAQGERKRSMTSKLLPLRLSLSKPGLRFYRHSRKRESMIERSTLHHPRMPGCAGMTTLCWRGEYSADSSDRTQVAGVFP
jgi:hypothetical protein